MSETGKRCGDLRWRVLAVCPLGLPDPDLVVAAGLGGGLGVLELGRDPRAARSALRRTADIAPAPFAVRVTVDGPLTPAEVLELGAGRVAALLVAAVPAVRPAVPVLVEVSSLAAAVDAVAAGADGLLARGHEAGGPVGELGSFVLLQHLLERQGRPVWVWGGVGPHTAAGAVACGAAGVVLDTQLALLPDSVLPPSARAAVARSDGSDTVVVNGNLRVLDLDPGLPTRPHPVPAAVQLGSRFLPVGQDAGLASRFAAAHDGVAAAVRAVVAAIDDAPAGDRPGGLGGLPVAQGPMTRVSDRPGFARAVAEHGGLPFLAVALADGPATAALLDATAAELGDRPWGAGLLGFLDDELHAAQLAAVRAARPPYALIAGGRPAQAAALEADGIATYLHVPSPVLLAQFLAAGARRFVFEGAECGGHIGPRSSFVLWEAQLGVLADHLDAHPDVTGVEIYLAGGIHDAHSAAIVSAMTAPLARRGVAVGVLMGTAYLFTAEAVAHGAVRETFQEQLVAAERTSVVQTAPGHRTRCLHTPFVDDFRAADAAMADAPARERWARLEELNTGRLRVASKGLRREGAELVEVDAAEQLATGMYMAGEAAVLRTGVTDVATLHAQVTTGAAEVLARRPVPRPATVAERPIAPLDIAIVGMACAFPGAPDLDAYTDLVLSGADAVTEVPAHRWDPAVYCDEQGTVASRWGAFLPEIGFDPLSFGIPPTSMGAIDPSQLLSLEIARRALADAGYLDRPFDRERAGVIFGAEAGSDLANASIVRALLPGYLDELPAELLDQLPELTEDSFPGTLSNVISGRIANRLDLGGANYTVDAACGSSLAAVAAACHELTSRASDLMLCGAVDLHNGINDYLLFTAVGALSPTGRCRPFDATADGIALGEGVACLTLKRLADAERDGDRIHAVIRGIGASSDGRSLGLTAPRPQGQHRALRRAYTNAGVSPADVGLVEAHGTGTVVGDGTELTTLTEFFREHGAAPGSCALGSVKSQIGHTKCAAGLAGMIKATLALGYGVVPPTLHLTEPNRAWDAATSPFTFTTAARPWATPRAGRIAGVSAFGFGGTNFHVVLAAPPTAPPRRHTRRDPAAELVLLPEGGAERLRAHLDGGWTLRDLAHTAAGWPGPVRFALVARDRAELADQLRAAIERTDAPGLHRADGSEPGQVAFLFSGQGSQHTGMLADLLVEHPELRHGADPGCLEVIHPPHAFTAEQADADEARLRDTRMAQPALGTVEIALLGWLDALGIAPDMLAGHSYGELVALAAAGAFDADTLLALSRERARAIVDAADGGDPGTMAAVRADRARVAEVLAGAGLADEVVLANLNAPEQVVVSGPTAAVEHAVAALRSAKVAAKRIPVACAFHSPVVAGAAPDFARVLAGAAVGAPDRPVWANATAAPYPADGVRAGLVEQIGSPVRFVEQIEAMYAAGARTFVEVGPGRVLTGLVGAVLGDRPHLAVAAAASAGRYARLTAVARLAAAGVHVDPAWLFRGRGCRDADLAPAPVAPAWTVDGQLARRADGVRPPHGLVPATRLRGHVMGSAPHSADRRDDLLADYLAGTRELVAAQRDVLLSYLGGSAAAPAPVRAPAVPAPAPVIDVAPVAPAVVVETAAPADALAAVVTVIADRTGYPPDMIDAELDLEADLSVDSIKRTEIVGLVVDRLGLAGRIDADELDALGRLRTAGALAARLRERVDVPAAPPAVPTDAPVPAGSAPVRHRLVDRPAPLPAARPVGGTVTLVPEVPGLTEQLVAAGVEVGADGSTLIDLAALAPGAEPVAVAVAGRLRTALAGGVTTVLVAAPVGTDGATPAQAVGLRGLLRSVAHEHPDALVRLIELPDGTDTARALVEELAAPEARPVITRGDTRTAPVVEPVDLGAAAHRGAGPGGVGESEAAAAGLGRDSVVLLVGGARGITARCAVALATATGCHVELAGRTVWPDEDEAPAVAAAEGPQAVRRALAESGTPLAEVEAAARAVLARREVAATVSAVTAAGGTAGYHELDVRDGAAVRQLVKDLHSRHGRLDGVVFAAGVLADRLLLDSDDAEFRTVFATKVDGVTALLEGIEQAGARPEFVTLFGSVAAVLGNRGQTAYAAANDAVDRIGADWGRRTGTRVLTVHWGPWAPGAEHPGMVSPELARDYARRGIGLIDPDAGVAALLRELAHGDADAVLYTVPEGP